MASFAQQFRAYPELLKSRRFWGYAFTAAFSSCTFFAYLGGAPFIGSNFYQLDAFQIGLYMALTPLGYVVGNGISGRFTNKFGLSRMIITGVSITLIGMSFAFIAALGGSQNPMTFFAFTITIGLGNGISLPSTNASLLDVKPELAGTASGLGGAILTFGGAAFSAFAAASLSPESGPMPLIICVLSASLLALTCALWTIRIERRLAAA